MIRRSFRTLRGFSRSYRVSRTRKGEVTKSLRGVISKISMVTNCESWGRAKQRISGLGHPSKECSPVISPVRFLAWPCFRVLRQSPTLFKLVEVRDHAPLTRQRSGVRVPSGLPYFQNDFIPLAPSHLVLHWTTQHGELGAQFGAHLDHNRQQLVDGKKLKFIDSAYVSELIPPGGGSSGKFTFLVRTKIKLPAAARG